MRCNHSGIVRGDWPAQAREWVQAVVPTFRAQRGGVSKRARKYSSLEKSVAARSRSSTAVLDGVAGCDTRVLSVDTPLINRMGCY